ncbi:unnamed protein product, partial [Rotaria sp. Silwood1]
MKSQLSYPSDEREAALNEEQPDEHQRQRVEIMEDGRVAIGQHMSERYQILGNIVVDEIQQALNELNKVDTYFSPIIGYAEEPLLPLPEATAPLTDILHNLSVYVQLALDETPENPPDGLTTDESAAVRLYTIEWERPHRSLYSMLNYTLKGVYQCSDPYPSPVTSETGKLPVAIVFGDFMNVNRGDLAVLNYDDRSVDILLGNGKNDYETEYYYTTDAAPNSVFNVDLNHDGLMDIVVTNGDDDSISVLLDNDDKTFQTSIEYLVGDNPMSVTGGDFDNDTLTDILVANSDDDT